MAGFEQGPGGNFDRSTELNWYRVEGVGSFVVRAYNGDGGDYAKMKAELWCQEHSEFGLDPTDVPIEAVVTKPLDPMDEQQHRIWWSALNNPFGAVKLMEDYRYMPLPARPVAPRRSYDDIPRKP